MMFEIYQCDRGHTLIEHGQLLDLLRRVIIYYNKNEYLHDGQVL